jgi:hypothetical protein
MALAQLLWRSPAKHPLGVDEQGRLFVGGGRREMVQCLLEAWMHFVMQTLQALDL